MKEDRPPARCQSYSTVQGGGKFASHRRETTLGYETLVVLPRVSSRRIVVIVFSIAPRLIIRVPRFIIPSAARYAPFAVLERFFFGLLAPVLQLVSSASLLSFSEVGPFSPGGLRPPGL